MLEFNRKQNKNQQKNEKMSLVVDDACVDIDTLIGPLPDFTLSFDKFFIEKAASLLNAKSKDMPVQKVTNCVKNPQQRSNS